MIRTGRLYEFVCEIIGIRNEEMEDQALWECWLHKDFGRTFAEYLEEMKQSNQPEATKEELTAIVKQSAEILSFVPPEEG